MCPTPGFTHRRVRLGRDSWPLEDVRLTHCIRVITVTAGAGIVGVAGRYRRRTG